MDTLKRAITLLGSQTALARACGVKQAHVWNWLNKQHGRVPPDQVIDIAAATNWRVTPHELRPDIYPHPDDGLPSERRGECRVEGEAA